MLFIREDIPFQLLSIKKIPDEAFNVKINVRENNWLLSCSYNPNKNNIQTRLENVNVSLALYENLTMVILT